MNASLALAAGNVSPPAGGLDSLTDVAVAGPPPVLLPCSVSGRDSDVIWGRALPVYGSVDHRAAAPTSCRCSAGPVRVGKVSSAARECAQRLNPFRPREPRRQRGRSRCRILEVRPWRWAAAPPRVWLRAVHPPSVQALRRSAQARSADERRLGSCSCRFPLGAAGAPFRTPLAPARRHQAPRELARKKTPSDTRQNWRSAPRIRRNPEKRVPPADCAPAGGRATPAL